MTKYTNDRVHITPQIERGGKLRAAGRHLVNTKCLYLTRVKYFLCSPLFAICLSHSSMLVSFLWEKTKRSKICLFTEVGYH